MLHVPLTLLIVPLAEPDSALSLMPYRENVMASITMLREGNTVFSTVISLERENARLDIIFTGLLDVHF